MPKDKNTITSLKRTLVPIIVGAVMTALLELGIDIDQGTITVLVTGLVTGAYYTALRLLEDKFPALGALLGAREKPEYREAS